MRSKWRFLVYLCGLVLLLAIQGSFFSSWSWEGTLPDLILLATISIGLLLGFAEGAVVGFLGGLLLGLASGQLAGASALAYGMAGIWAGWLRDRLPPDLLVVPLLAAGVGTIVCQAIYLGVNTALGIFVPGRLLPGTIFTLLGYNLLLAIPMYLALHFLVRTLGEGRYEDRPLGAR